VKRNTERMTGVNGMTFTAVPRHMRFGLLGKERLGEFSALCL